VTDISAPKPVVDLEARDMTGMSDIPNRVSSPADRKACPVRSYGGAATRSRRVFLSGEGHDRNVRHFVSCPKPTPTEEQLRASSGPSPSIRHSSFVTRTFPDVFEPVIHEESITRYSLPMIQVVVNRVEVRGASRRRICGGQHPRIARRCLTVLTYRLPLC
jgi:hypothetical protein